MQSFRTLPAGYTEYDTLDLQKDKKKALLVNILATLIAVVMAVVMHVHIPFSLSLRADDGAFMPLIRLIALFVLMFAYLFLHELIHGAVMKICGTEKVTYGLTGIYAYAGSTDYYDRPAYIMIALAPVVVFLVVFTILLLLVPLSWFWTIYFLQILNVSGAAGDLYVTYKCWKLPKDLLIQDAGVRMVMYTKQ